MKFSKSPELRIQLASGLDFSLPNLSESTTLFEVKQAIEKVRGFKVDQQILRLD